MGEATCSVAADGVRGQLVGRRRYGRRLADMISHDARTGMVSVDFAAFNATVPEEDA